MDALPLTLVLLSAALHASWNLAVKTSSDRFLTAAAQVIFGAILAIPVLVFGGIPTEAWRSVVASGLIHLVYGLSLAGGYERGDLSLVYPVARGTAPVLVTVAAALILDDIPSAGGVIAIGLAVGGILLMARSRTGAGLGWAFMTAAAIAGYTTVDGAAVRTLSSAIPYTAAVSMATAILFSLTVVVRRSRAEIVAAVRRDWAVYFLAGGASIAAYMLVLAAARLAPLGVVAAFRETSILFGVLGAWLILGEEDAKGRLASAGLLAVGLIVLVVAG